MITTRGIRSVLARVLPQTWYGSLYKCYHWVRNTPLSKEKIIAFSKFTTRGVYPCVLDHTEFSIYLDPNNRGVDAEIFAEQCYEKEILRFIRSKLTFESTFVDIGANIGQHSLFASRWCRHVYAFEPIGHLYDQFRNSIFENDFFNISPFNYALGNVSNRVPIYNNTRNAGASSLVVHHSDSVSQIVKIVRLDDVYTEIDITRVDITKIDVEGYELEVLKGGKNFFTHFKPIIIMEYTPLIYETIDDHTARTIFDLIRSWGYEVHRFETQDCVQVFEDLGKDQETLLCIPQQS